MLTMLLKLVRLLCMTLMRLMVLPAQTRSGACRQGLPPDGGLVGGCVYSVGQLGGLWGGLWAACGSAWLVA